MKLADQPEAVATGDKDGLGFADRRARIARAVHTGDVDAMRRKPLLESDGGTVVITLGIRDHHRAPGTAEMLDDRRSGGGAITTCVQEQTSIHEWRDLLDSDPVGQQPQRIDSTGKPARRSRTHASEESPGSAEQGAG